MSVSLPQELHGALSLIWEEQKFTDVDFLLCGQVIPAHKAVLAAQSQYFECMLYGSMREASMSDIVLEDVPISAFRKVLQFAYTGSLHLEMVTLQVYNTACCQLELVIPPIYPPTHQTPMTLHTNSQYCNPSYPPTKPQ